MSFPESSYYYTPNDSRLLGWLREALQEGERVNKSDPEYDSMDSRISYVMGNQLTGDHPSYVHRVVINQCKKAILQHASALTDLAPSFAYQSANPRFVDSTEVLNQYTQIWWINGFIDQELQAAIQYSATIGSGDVLVEFDPEFLGGDTRLTARDPRDTLPIRPEKRGRLQDWEGLTIRENHSVNKLLGMYPDQAHIIKPNSGLLNGIFTKFMEGVSRITTPMTTLSGLGANDPNKSKKNQPYPEVTLFRTFFQDRRVNTSAHPVLIGKPNTNWCYLVDTGKPLYPRGRLIVWTESGVLSDGPNPYWHAKYPVSRLQLQPWPWLFFGASIFKDLKGLQDATNITVNDILQVVSQTVNRGSFWDKSTPTNIRKRFDPRRPNWKVQKPNNFSDGMKLAEPPMLPPYIMPLLQLFDQKFSDLSGTANLQQLLSLRQMPSGDTIEKYANALTPEIRMEGRGVEYFLRDVAVMIKGNLFQFQSASKRFVVLGDSAKVLEDLDWDPATMIPAMKKTDEGYVPELDETIPRDERAKFFLSQFSFFVEPNSMLAFNSTEKKMLMLQLSRAGLVDIWTLFDTLNIPNAGTPPMIPLPVAGQPVALAPGQLPAMELRQPRTITEKLMAMQQLGLGQQANPAGRKASGQEPPSLETKGDRTTVTES